MRFLVSLMIIAAAGCARQKPEFRPVPPPASSPALQPNSTSATPGPDSSTQKLIVTPENALVGKVASVNSAARFVVVNFPVGHLPATDARLNVYRRGLRVGELKTTAMQLDDNIVADIMDGEVEIGDEAREK